MDQKLSDICRVPCAVVAAAKRPKIRRSACFCVCVNALPCVFVNALACLCVCECAMCAKACIFVPWGRDITHKNSHCHKEPATNLQNPNTVHEPGSLFAFTCLLVAATSATIHCWGGVKRWTNKNHQRKKFPNNVDDRLCCISDDLGVKKHSKSTRNFLDLQ